MIRRGILHPHKPKQPLGLNGNMRVLCSVFASIHSHILAAHSDSRRFLYILQIQRLKEQLQGNCCLFRRWVREREREEPDESELANGVLELFIQIKKEEIWDESGHLGGDALSICPSQASVAETNWGEIPGGGDHYCSVLCQRGPLVSTGTILPPHAGPQANSRGQVLTKPHGKGQRCTGDGRPQIHHWSLTSDRNLCRPGDALKTTEGGYVSNYFKSDFNPVQIICTQQSQTQLLPVCASAA